MNGIGRKLIWLILFFSINASAQKSTISGYLKDSETGEALIGARIYVDSLKQGSVTNAFGFYSLTLPLGQHTLLYSSVGKEPVKMQIDLDEDVDLDINLKPGGTLTTIVVNGEKKEQESTEMGVINLSMSKVKSLPVLLGEYDIIKTAQLLPGIQSGNEGSSGLYVRGGGPDQNLILLDGVPIYNANHLFGFFSVFNADAINQVKLVKGGFPAMYGGRLSSVIDITMNEGNMKKINAEGNIGLISAKLMVNGPIIKDKTSFMVSARRTYIDFLSQPIINWYNSNQNTDAENEIKGGYFFYDINAKLNHIFNKNNRLYFSAYVGNDKFYFQESLEHKEPGNLSFTDENTSNMNWGNAILALRWNHRFGPQLFSNATLSYSRYSLNTEIGTKTIEKNAEFSKIENFAFNYLSGITDWSGNIHFYYYPNPNHKIQFGLGETYHTFNPGVNQVNFSENSIGSEVTFGSSEIFAHEFNSYIQDDFKISKRLAANLGIHLAHFYVREKLYNRLQPRASLNYRISPKASLKASYSKTTQFLHLLTNTTIGLPTDLWVSSTDSIGPQEGYQVALGYTQELTSYYRISSEIYYKTMKNLIEYKEGASFFGHTESWENLIETGRGNSYGAEILFEKRRGKTTGWIGYTLSWSNRQFPRLNKGNPFPYRYDRRHDISVAITHKFNDRIDIGVIWVYGTGNAVTLATKTYIPSDDEGIIPGQEIKHISERNGYRMPAYHRLDLGVNIHKKKKWGEAVWSFGLYNAYNRKNPFFLQIGKLPDDPSGKKVLKQISIFPVLPSISYRFKF